MNSIGQDSIVTVNNHNKKKIKKVSYSKKLNYYFNNAVSKTGYFILFLIAASFVLGLIMTVIQYYIEGNSEISFFDKWWESVTKILGLGSGATWGKRLISFLFWVFSIAISSTVIGFIAMTIKSLVEELKRGKSQIITKDHILILGWSNGIFSILKELSIANENVKNTVVVIFSKLGNEKMQDEIAANIDFKLNLKILTRSGDISNPIELEIVNPNEAKTIVVLNNDKKSDSQVIITILALASIVRDNSIAIIAQINNSFYIKDLANIKNINFTPVLSQNIITNVTAQALRQKGIGAVILDLLDFEGDEIYFSEIPQLINKTYTDAILSFENSSVIGIVESNGNTKLNPSSDTIIQKGDKIILISEDDSTIFYEPQQLLHINNFKLSANKSRVEEKSILFIGWSEMGINIFNSLAPFLSENSNITVLYLQNYVDKNNLTKTDFNTIKINFKEMDLLQFNLKEFIENGNFEEIMVLGYTNDNSHYTKEISTTDADVISLLEIVKLDNIKQQSNAKSFRVIAQMFDSYRAKLAGATATEELIVSDNFSAILIAQLIENPDLNNVFNDLFDVDGASINVYPIENYAELEKEIKYINIVSNGSKYNESVIGIRIDNKETNNHTEGVYLNPSKNKLFTPKKGDQVIVIGSN